MCDYSPQGLRAFRCALPNHNHPPAAFPKRSLVEFVAGGVAVEFRQPPFAPVRRRRAVLAALMPVPEAAVNEDGGFMFLQEDID